VQDDYSSNVGAVRYNEARSNSDLPGLQYNVKSDAINVANADEAIKGATYAKLETTRGEVEQQGNDARVRNDDWCDANIPGAVKVSASAGRLIGE
jgi:hypothetical protein